MTKKVLNFYDNFKAAVSNNHFLGKKIVIQSYVLAIVSLLFIVSLMPIISASGDPPYGPSNPIPSDGARLCCTSQVTLSVNVSDPEEDTMDVCFYDASDDSLIDCDYNVGSDSRASTIWMGLSCCQTYSWYACADDGANITCSATWDFHINEPPSPPTSISFNPSNPKVTDVLEATASGSSDCDGDTIIYYYKFENINDGWDTNWSTNNTLQLHVSDAHNTIKTYAKANDSLEESTVFADTIMISNSCPTDPTNYTPECGSTNVQPGTVPLSVDVFDADNDTMNVSFYEWDPTKSILIDSEQDWLNGSFTNTETDGMGNLRLLEPSNTVAYGDGSDGSYTVTADKTLTEDKSYTDLTVQSGVTLDTAGYILRVSGTLTNYGTITDTVSGGSGGNGGSGGDGGYHNGPIDNQPPENGHCGNNGQPGSCPTAGHGGDSGDGGGGGGSAWHTWTSNNAHGGDGGNGGDGGDGGGHVMIYTNTLNNQGTIHANGFPGQNGQNGENGQEVDFTYLLVDKDLCGGGGGGGSAGDGGDGGSVDLVYNQLITQGTLSANGGAGGNPGSGGNGRCCEQGVNNGNHEDGASGCGCGGGGGAGEHQNGECAKDGYNADDCELNGEQGIISENETYHVSTGTYYQVIDAGTIVNWTSVVILADSINYTTYDVSYSIPNNTDQYSDITNVPDSRYLNISISLSSLFHSKTPLFDSIEVGFDLLLIDTDYEVGSGETATVNWTNRESFSTYYWIVMAEDEYDGVKWSSICEFTTTGNCSLCEGVDNCNLTWSTNGDAIWVCQNQEYYYDNDSCQSGDIEDNEESWIQTNVTGPVNLSFYWKVSSEQYWDYLRFYIDDVLFDEISGDVDWQQQVVSIGSGVHTLKWAYEKDGSVTYGNDCGWLDNVVITSYPVHNIDTGEDFCTIQAAIDDADTLNGHTIMVDSGTYDENVIVNKQINLFGENKSNTMINALNSSQHTIKIISDNVNITGFDITGATLQHVSAGIFVEADNCTVSHNRVTGNWFGILIRYSDYNTISHNIVTNNGVTGSGIYLSHCKDNVISHNNASCNYVGIGLLYSDNNIISLNNASDSSVGIKTEGYCDFNLIINNTLNDNVFWGLTLETRCDNNTVTNNEFKSNGYPGVEGVTLGLCSYNILSNNNMINSGISLKSGTELNHWNTHTIINNTLNGKPVVYWKNRNGGTIQEEAGEIILANCTNITIQEQNLSKKGEIIQIGFSSHCTISNNIIANSHATLYFRYSNYNKVNDNIISDGEGIHLVTYCTNNTIKNNLISANQKGIYFWYADNNTITENSITHNTINGIKISYSNNNLIFNNYFNNTNNANDSGDNIWNVSKTTGPNIMGGPYIGGNFWSDHTYTDNNSDGFCDTAYTVPGDSNTDWLPLTKNVICFNLSFKTGWNLITIPVNTDWFASDILNNVSAATMVSWYDTVNETYKTATSGGGYDFPLQCGWGYFVYVTNTSDLMVNGTFCMNVSVPLDVGWNMIGWYHEHNTTASSLMENISNCTMISWYNTVNETYKTRTSGGGYDFIISQGMGVFVYTTKASIWYGEG